METVPAKSVPPVIVLRVVVRAPDLDAFITNYSRFIDGDRIFIFTKNPQQPGTRVRFSLHLENGEQLIHGKGTVTRTQGVTGDATRPPGMELVFVAIDPRSQTLIDFMAATRTGAVDEVSDGPAGADLALEPSVSAPPPLPLPQVSTEGLRAEALKRAVLRGRDKPPEPSAPPPPSAPRVAEPEPQAKVVVEDQTAAPVESAALVDTAPMIAPAPADAAPAFARAPVDAAPVDAAPASAAASAPALNPPGPTPSFAEGWRDPLPPGEPGADPKRSVPANPFSEVSDGAIDYFVEWSLEQSIGPRREASASFSNVEMALPVTPPEPPPVRASRRAPILLGLGALAGIPVGALLAWAIVRRPEPPPAPPPVVAVAPPPAPAPPPPPANAELVVSSRPSGAQVTVDGEARGPTPLTLSLAAGAHQIKVAKDRYAAAESTVSAPGKLQIELKRPPATLEIVSEPSGAQVTVAGEPRGRTPAQVKLPAFEQYDVQVAMPSGKPWRRKVYLKQPSVHVVAVLGPRKHH
ncbi:MAG TPA: PEGA domain-containing protein [Polyangia bacterium]|nr:PEGA domain-containing protein [Polyangia bacterium]